MASRRWFQYSLRGFLVVLTALSVWLGIMVKRKQDEHEAIKVIESAGGEVQYGWESIERDPFPLDPAPRGPAWLRRLVGDDYFQEVETVDLMKTGNSSLAESEIMALVPTLQRLPWLKELRVPPDLSKNGINELRAALPNCLIWFPTF